MNEAERPFVHRTPKAGASRFVRIDNSVLQNDALSFRARGLLAYVLSMPLDWRHSADDLANKKERKHAVRSALKDLVAAGHARLVTVRESDGTVRNRWAFSEAPTLGKPSVENQHSAPSADLPSG